MRGAGVLECWSAGVLGCWSAGVLECWGVGVLECWGAGVLECWGAGVLGCWSAGVLGCWKVGTGEKGERLPRMDTNERSRMDTNGEVGGLNRWGSNFTVWHSHGDSCVKTSKSEIL